MKKGLPLPAQVAVVFLWCGTLAAQVVPSCAPNPVPVLVTNEKHEPATGLTAADFRAKVAGKEATIVSAREASSHRILILLGTTGAIFRPAVVETIARVTGVARPETLIGLATYSSAYELESRVAFTTDRQSVLSSLPTLEELRRKKQRIRPRATLDVVYQSLRLFEDYAPGDVILLITTTWPDDKSSVSNRALEEAIEQRGLRVFAILFVEGPDFYYSDLAHNSGGSSFDLRKNLFGNYSVSDQIVKKRDALEEGDKHSSLPHPPRDDLEHLVAQMNHFYLVDVHAVGALKGRQRLEVKVGSRDKLHAKYPRFWFPCADKPAP